MIWLDLIFPAFFAGILTFLAPCTLPLVPGYLGFISGVSAEDLKQGSLAKNVRLKILKNAFFYVAGFGLVFILLGGVFGLVGGFLLEYRFWLEKAGAVLIIFFGIYILLTAFNIDRFKFLAQDRRVNLFAKLKPGKPSSSFLFGATFAFGWTPCVGPVLGSVLLLATTAGTGGQGFILLAVFSLGLSLPFIVLVLLISRAIYFIRKLTKFLNVISVLAGIFLIFLGFMILTGNLGIFTREFYNIFRFLNLEKELINFL